MTAVCSVSSLIFATGRDPTSGLLGHEFEKVNEGVLGFQERQSRLIQQSTSGRQCGETSVSKFDTEQNNLLLSPSECDVAVRDGPCEDEDRDVGLFSFFADWFSAALFILKEYPALNIPINRLAALRSIFFSNRRKELDAPSEALFLKVI